MTTGHEDEDKLESPSNVPCDVAKGHCLQAPRKEGSAQGLLLHHPDSLAGYLLLSKASMEMWGSCKKAPLLLNLVLSAPVQSIPRDTWSMPKRTKYQGPFALNQTSQWMFWTESNAR